MRDPIEVRLAAAGLPPLPRTAWLEIDLDALVENLGILRRGPAGDRPIRPVVKADAYGHGAVMIARTLVGAGVDGLCVATIDEAMALRAAGIEAPLLVLYPVPAGWAAEAALARITVSAGDPGLLAGLLAVSATDGGEDALHIELEVETGLGRGGFDEPGLVEAAHTIEEAPHAVIAGLWTHLQAPEDAGRTTRQLARFDAAAAALAVAGIVLPPRHVTASGGLASDGVAEYDGVRPGLAVYGLLPDGLDATQRDTAVARTLRPVLSLHARAVRVADLPTGWGISYGPTFVTRRPSRIATLPLGYGDGWSRSLSGRADALVRGQRVPVVGAVAMDAILVDVTDVRGPVVTSADEFTLIGTQGTERITVADLAQTRTTISWEVVAAMARRLPRVYHAAPGLVGLRTLTERSWDLVARIELWNGDICDLEVDAIVNAANTSLWMSTGVGGAIKRAGGDDIEFAAVQQGPVALGGAIVTTGGALPVRVVIHAVSLDRERRTSAAVIEQAVRSAMRRACELGVTSIAFPALGTGVGGFPIDEGARITVQTVREELPSCPTIANVIFALRGQAAYQAFAAAMAASQPVPQAVA